MKILNRDEVCVLIPAFNESLKIQHVLRSIKLIGASILVIDDGSTDNTTEICKLENNIHLIQHKQNHGYVSALNTGFKYLSSSNFKYIVTFDADDQLSVDDIVRFYHLATTNDLDIVVGHRNYMNRMSEYIFSLFSSLLLNLNDPFCGLKLYRLDSIKKYLPFDKYNLIGSELLIRSKYKKLKIDHLPIISQKRVGPSKFGNSISGEIKVILASLFILYNHLFKNKLK